VTTPELVGDHHPYQEAVLALFFCICATALLYNDTSHVGASTQFLWAGTVVAIVATLVAGFSHFDADNFGTVPDGALEMPGLIGAIAIAMRLGVYDMAGYYDVCYIGDSVKDARNTLPKAVVWSAVTISVVYALIYVAIMGYMPWFGPDGFTNKDSLAYQHVMSIFFERMCGHSVAVAFTCLVVFTIFGSAFAMMVGYVSIPKAAADDGYFLEWFSHMHPTRAGLADNSLLVFSATTACFCFVRLELVIEAMLTMRLIIQFAAQALAVIMTRESDGPWGHGLWGCCAYLALPGYLFLFFSTQNYAVSGQAPLLEFSVVFMMMGMVAYGAWAGANAHWPFRSAYGEVKSDLITMPLTDATEDEIGGSI